MLNLDNTVSMYTVYIQNRHMYSFSETSLLLATGPGCEFLPAAQPRARAVRGGVLVSLAQPALLDQTLAAGLQCSENAVSSCRASLGHREQLPGQPRSP